MKRLKRILEILKMYINKLFKKEPKLLIENNNKNQINYTNDCLKVEEMQYSKKEIFKLYQNVKAGNVAIENLMINDLIKVMSIMKDEISIQNEKIEKDLAKVMDMDSEIKILETENQTFSKSFRN